MYLHKNTLRNFMEISGIKHECKYQFGIENEYKFK